MEKDKKSKKKTIDKLRMILDNDSKKDLHPEDEKHLKSLSQRLKSTSQKEVIYNKKTVKYGEEKDVDSLKPRVTIHTREIKKPVISIDIEEKKKPREIEEIALEDEDIFEVEKVKVEGPEFVEVKPKESEKKEEFIPVPPKKEEKKEIDELAEWKPVEVSEKEQKEIPSKKNETETFIDIEKNVDKPKKASVEDEKEVTIGYCESCGCKLIEGYNFCTKCGHKIEEIKEKTEDKISDKEETTKPIFIPVKKLEEKYEGPKWEPVEEEPKEKVESVPIKELPIDDLQIFEEKEIDRAVKIEAFKDIVSIDEETAVLLYDNGFISVESLKIASYKDLSRVKGIKRKTAKNIKKELEQKEVAPEELKKDEIKEDSSKIESILTGEIAGVEISEEQINDNKEEKDSNREIKIEAFKDIESIDEETAVLLYDNGFTTEDSLKQIDLKNLTKIKGLKKKKAKEIKKEIEKKIEESVDVKPIVTDQSSEGELSEEQIQIKNDNEVFEDETKELKPVELSPKNAEWAPVNEEEIVEVEEKTQEKIEEDQDFKIEPFKEIESIDETTAILLYDSGFTSVDSLKQIDLKNLTKIKGLKKKTAKNIKKELEEKNKENPEEIVKTEQSEKFLEEKEINNESQDLDEKILNHKPEEKEEEIFEEEEKIESIQQLTKDDEDVFKDIKSIDEKISRLLQENSIDSMKVLQSKTIKELTKIRGIKKKKAKEIKKEIDEIIKRKKEENESYNREDNPFIDESGDEEWDFLDEDKMPEEVILQINEYQHGEYTLYEKEITTKSGKKQKIRFFSKGKPEDGKPIQIPDGYEVKENKKTGVPYIRKKK